MTAAKTFLVNIALIDTSCRRCAGWPVNLRGPGLSGRACPQLQHAPCILRRCLNSLATIYPCRFLQGLQREQENPDWTKLLGLTAGQALGGPESYSPVGTAAWNSCLFFCLPRGSLMLLATPGLNRGKTYQIDILIDMVWDRGARPEHAGIFTGAAKAKQKERGSCPGLVSRKCLCPLGFSLKSSQGSVH